MCRTWKVDPAHELTVREIRQLLRGMPGLFWLDVTGGEPLFRKDAFEVFDAVLESTPHLLMLHFQTNGFMTERAVALCRHIRRRRDVELVVTVSIDGPREVHDRIRGRQGSFDRALATFRALRAEAGVEVFVGTTLGPTNYDRIDELEAVLQREFPDFRSTEHHLNWVQRSSHFFQNADLPPFTDHRIARRQLRRRGVPRSLIDVMELVYLVNAHFTNQGEASEVTCQALRSAAFVSPEGDLYPCHMWDRPLGSLRDRSAEELWAAPETRAAREEAVALACGGCFTPCEAYPALAGAPFSTLRHTSRRAIRLLVERGTAKPAPTKATLPILK